MGVKIVPNNIKDIQTTRGLAIWLQDDGSYNRKNESMELATHSLLKLKQSSRAMYLRVSLGWLLAYMRLTGRIKYIMSWVLKECPWIVCVIR